ncbi:neuroglian isoform X2 [Aplysia californica]|uniref:Neuroglian isoform X2 n=1 Tax=Aplysia californica TaxID=6500 RepID=A0ABM1VVH8_APLCA|nr:neuroglian isoform X2 [Aplysia californica]
MELRILCSGLLLAIFACVIVDVSAQSGGEQDLKNCLPPSVRKRSPRRMYFIVNEQIRIACIATGNKTLVYTWLKDGEVLDFNSKLNKGRVHFEPGVGSLILTKAQDQDSGVYQCRVTNNCGTALTPTTRLLHAKIDPFTPQDKPELIKVMMGSSTVLECNPPTSVPKAVIAWILMDSTESMSDVDELDYDDVGFITVEQNRRVTMDYNGNLYITSARKEDEQGGKSYVCAAQNMRTRSSNKGEDKLIKVQGVTPTSFGVDLMWHSNTTTMVLEGKRARFKCIFSGNPEPEVSWVRVNGNLRQERMQANHHEFIIEDVLYEDAGEYKCMGRNSLQRQPIEHTFTLNVEAAPAWRSHPRDVTVGVEESASFECEAVGNPKPTVEFYVNGKAIDEAPSNPRRTLKGNTLFFSNLEKSDSQVIQCNASNSHGSIWADVYLYVQALPPTIEKPPQDRVVTAEGKDLTLSCQVTGKPKPKVVWYKGVQPLVHKRFQITEKGDLIIKKTNKKKDPGTYRCIAENKFGKAEAEGQVVVRMKTSIATKPIGEQVDYTNPVTFTCGAVTDKDEVANLKYRWLKDGAELEPSDRVSIKAGVLTIMETSSKDTGSYTCVAENGLDNDTATATLQVKAVPDPPYNVSVSDCLAKKAIIKWKFEEKMRNFDTMTKFIVESTTAYKNDVWEKEVTLPYPAYEASINLSPYAKYKFRVKAVNMMGISDPSHTTYSWCETPMSLPDKNPDGVETDEQFTNFLVVKWEPMEEIDLNGPQFRYLVEVQEIGTDDVQTFEVDDFRENEKHIPVNNTYKPYLVKVRAVNQVGKAMANPLAITGYSGEAPPLVVPDNFELDPDVNVTATSAGFRWDPVDTSPEMIRGEFSGYKIRFWKKGQQDITFHEHIVQEEADSFRRRRQAGDRKVRGLVANLPSYAEVEADVVVINKNFESNGSNVVNFSTPEGVPGRVEYLEALYRGSHHFLLQWAPPKEQNGVVTGYKVSYQRIKRLDFGAKQLAYDNLAPDQNRVTLRGLIPDSQYRVFIQASTKEGLGKEYFIDIRTNSGVLSMALPVVQDVESSEDEANITWGVLSADKGSRHGQFYYIEYRKLNTEKWMRDKDVVEGQFWGELKHLEPGTRYEVRVLAMAHEKGESRPSKPFPFATSGVGASRASFLSAAWFIGMMVAIIILILILIIVCIIKRNRGDNYPVQEKERLRGNYNDDNPDHFNGFGKGDENGLGGSSSFDRDAEKVPLDEDTDSLDYGDDDASKFNEDGSFIGQYGRGEKGNEGTNASSIV